MNLKIFWFLVFLPLSHGERQWDYFDTQADSIFSDWHYHPHQCCQMCGWHEEWRNTDYVKGRCIVRDKEHLGNWNSLENQAGSQRVIARKDCCFYCGEQPGDYEYISKGDDFDGYCLPVGKVEYVIHGFDGSGSFFPHDKEVVDNCHFCRTLVTSMYSLIQQNPDHISVILEDSCETFKEQMKCKLFVKQNFNSIHNYYSTGVSVHRVCGHYMPYCPEEALSDETYIEMERDLNRTTVLHPYLDSSPLSSKSLMKMTNREIQADKYLRSQTSNKITSDLHGLKFLAQYSLISNARQCQLCPNQKMHFVKNPRLSSSVNDSFVFRCASCRANSGGQGGVIEPIRQTFLFDINGNLRSIIDVVIMSAQDLSLDTHFIEEKTALSLKTIEMVREHVAFSQQGYILNMKNATSIGGPQKFVEFYEARLLVRNIHESAYSFDKNRAVFIAVDTTSLDIQTMVIFNPQLADVVYFMTRYIDKESIVIAKDWSVYQNIAQFAHEYTNSINTSFAYDLISESSIRVPVNLRTTFRMLKATEQMELSCVDASINTLFHRFVGVYSVGTTLNALALYN